MKMTHPNAPASITIAGITYSVVDGPIEIPNDVAAIARSHGFVDAPEAEPDDDGPEASPIVDEFHAMKRVDLFHWLADHGVSAKPPIGNDELRAMARAAAADLAKAKSETEPEPVAEEEPAEAPKVDAVPFEPPFI